MRVDMVTVSSWVVYNYCVYDNVVSCLLIGPLNPRSSSLMLLLQLQCPRKQSHSFKVQFDLMLFV